MSLHWLTLTTPPRPGRRPRRGKSENRASKDGDGHLSLAVSGGVHRRFISSRSTSRRPVGTDQQRSDARGEVVEVILQFWTGTVIADAVEAVDATRATLPVSIDGRTIPSSRNCVADTGRAGIAGTLVAVPAGAVPA